MDLSPFKLDIDDLLKEFAEGELKTLEDMKKVWLGRKFSYIFEGRPSTNLALFMQTLYSHCMSYMIATNSLSHRLGALYCLYCLYETQPFKPPFKIYLSLGELRRLKNLVVEAKEMGIKVLSVVVKRMLEKNAFLFGSVDFNDYSEKERIKELVLVQNACIQKMHERLLADEDIGKYLRMDLGMELDLKMLLTISSEYAGAKSLALREASEVVDVESVRHIAEDRLTFGDELLKLNEEWGNHKELYSQETRAEQLSVIHHSVREDVQKEQLMLLSASGEGPDDNLMQDTSFMELLMGSGSPQANENTQPSSSEPHSELIESDMHDDDFDFAKDLESQLFEDLL